MLNKFGIKVRQKLYSKRTSWPYLSGDAMLHFCGSDPSHKFFFTRSDELESALEKLSGHPYPFVLLASNSDRDFYDLKFKLPDNLLALYLQNSHISDGVRVFTLPIGAENLRHGMNGVQSLLKSNLQFNEKERKILIGPFGNTHPSRAQLLDLPDSELIHVVRSRLSPRKYAEIADRYRFVACPRGNGEDTHRVWETLYRNSIPVVLENQWSNSLKPLGLPILTVKDWSEESLSKAINNCAIVGELNSKKMVSLWMDTWVKTWRAQLS